ncbi:MAG: ADP-ribosylglycohydrolase family protein [Anaerolineae bacterium]
MLGAIAGDVIGSVYERHRIKTTEFPFFPKGACFTDDTVMTLAVAQAILQGTDYAVSMKAFGRKYPNAGYGRAFVYWLREDETRPYNSWGNGAAMRASPVGFAFDNVEDILREARRSAEVSHDHPEGIKGAQATALAVWLARTGASKKDIRGEIARRFGYDLDRTIDAIRPVYRFDSSCQGSVPEALIAFLESTDYESAVRKAISLGGDSDTLACIAGGVAHAFYKHIPAEIVAGTRHRLPEEFRVILDRFDLKFPLSSGA